MRDSAESGKPAGSYLRVEAPACHNLFLMADYYYILNVDTNTHSVFIAFSFAAMGNGGRKLF